MSRVGTRLARLARVSAAVGATAAVGGLASSEVRSRWYADLDKPSFQPPDVAFPVAWTALYTDLVLTAGHALDRLDTAGRSEEAAGCRRAPVGIALAPYPAWCGFATLLSTALARRNR